MKNPLKMLSGSRLGSYGAGLALLGGAACGELVYFPSGDAVDEVEPNVYWMPADPSCRPQAVLELPYSSDLCYLGWRKGEVTAPVEHVFGTLSGNKSENFTLPLRGETHLGDLDRDYRIIFEEATENDGRAYAKIRVVVTVRQ